MKFAILSLAAAGALAFSAGSALAGPPGHGHYHGGYQSFHPIGPHLDYHRGHYHYHDGFYRSPPLAPVYPSYRSPNYGYYNTRPGFSITIGSGSGLYPAYGGYSRPYYGGFGPRW